ncbi:hypothetical protein Angca_009568 [Angiostrongylus cantonensis]|nr:hypothetical protein Angca_009568 [Angiostrongylus cantonensis]
MSCSGSDSDCELEYALQIGDIFDDIGHCPPNSNNCSEDEGIRDVQSDDELEMASCSSGSDDVVLISVDSLKFGFFETERTGVLRITHRSIHIEDIVLEPDAIEIRFTCSDPDDRLLRKYGEVRDTTFAWRVHLAGLIETDSLQVCAEGREFVMRKQEAGQWGRLSSSTTSIRSSHYSTPRNYGPSSYRYTASSYAPSTQSSSNPTSASNSEQNRGCELTRPSTTSTLTSIVPSRSLALSGYQRLPYITPAAQRSSAFSPSTFLPPTSASSLGSTNTAVRSYVSSIGHTPSSYTLAASSSGPSSTAADGTTIHTQTANSSTSTTIRSRSSSAIASYRSVNVAQLNIQARERAERDEKLREFKEWEERERLQLEMEAGQKRFNAKRRPEKTFSPSYGQYASVATRTEPGKPDLLPNNAGPPPASADLQRYQSSYSGYKPTATVQPFEDRVVATVPFGFTGLRNIGNTCFMNATLQMLINNIELKTYFLDRYYKLDVNPNNPLGFRGRLADAFGDFMRLVWNGQNRAVEPTKIKELVAEKASQFANFAQHDAHEFLSFLLDGLHEDLNRVKSKPLTTTVEGDGRSDVDVSNEAWFNHTLRNDSIFVDLFHGQLKSRLQCPKCDRVSITFDPFVYLPVPFPKLKKTMTVWFWPHDPSLNPLEVSVDLHILFHDPADCNEPVVELFVVQRQLYPSTLRYACNECGRSTEPLKACEACYNAYYCNKECQLSNWNKGGHRDECRKRTTADYVGQPFMVSLPRSQLTYCQLIRVLEARCRFSVDIFQPPQLSSSSGESKGSNGNESEASNADEIGNPMTSYAMISFKPSPASCTTDVTPRRQSVLPEQQKKPEFKMFLVRKLLDQAHVLGETIVNDKTGQPLDLKTDSYISINWYNLRNGRPFISVENKKTLQVDQERSEQMMKQKRMSTPCINGDPTLQDMLGMFSETERLKPEESWYCNKCRDHVEATKKLELFRLPPIFIVQLKRFVYTDWRLFDDSVVSKQSINNVQSDDAYLLFYKQRGVPTRSIFRKHYSCDPTEDELYSDKVSGNTELLVNGESSE